ncbi:MAG: hypothetical protein MPF33_05790 [Candidatus Aramenus sp.]|jgi:hypothetical protein|nr:hypothetical protein [Candidatus Aramenus sp.]
MRKALSTVIFLIILTFLLIAVLIPAFVLFNSTPVYLSQGNIQASVYTQLQKEQQEEVYRGNPNIYYNSTTTPTIEFIYTNLPAPLNITQIYYFNGQTWMPILDSNLIVATNTTYPLPPQSFNNPILIVTSQSNFFFLNPNTSVTTIAIPGPQRQHQHNNNRNNNTNTKQLLPYLDLQVKCRYITAFVINGSKILPVSIQTVLGSGIIGNTPQILYLNPGTYQIADKNGSTIFLPQYGLTANFQNWTLVGQGSFTSSASSLSTSFTVTGPLVLTIIYKASLEKFSVTIRPANLPLGETLKYNGITLSSLNNTIAVIVDNKVYEVPRNGITLSLTYGYHIVEFPLAINISFNYTGGYFTPSNGFKYGLYAGNVTCYTFQSLSTNTQKISVVGQFEVFVNSSGVIYGNFKPFTSYYLVIVKNDFCLPSGLELFSNTTPVLGDIARQLLQVSYNGESIDLGPIKNYVPEMIYFKQGTGLEITIDYPAQLSGTFNINDQIYNGLMSCPISLAVYSISSHPSYYYPKPSLNNYGTIYVNMPLLLINYEEWEYGGEPYS